MDKFAGMLDWALRLVVLIALPSAIGLFLLAGPMLTTIFYGGRFTADDVQMATLSLMAYSFGLLGFILVKVLVPGYFARQDTKTPVKIGIIALLVNMLLNVAFVVPWYQSGAPGPHAGLALATSLSSFLNAGLLYRGLRRDGVIRHRLGWSRFLLRVLVACCGHGDAAQLLCAGQMRCGWKPASLSTACGWPRRCSAVWWSISACCSPSACGRPSCD